MSKFIIPTDALKRPEVGEIWVNRKNKRKVEIRASASPVVVWYKALLNPNGGHTAEAKKPIGTFLKEFEFGWATPAALASSIEEAAQAVRDAGGLPPLERERPEPWPQTVNTSTLSMLAAVIRQRANKLYAFAERGPYEQCQHAMHEIADALEEIASDSSLIFERNYFLSLNVSDLVVKSRILASVDDARRVIAAGDVYLDGQRVTEDAPITTVTRERFTVRCGERSAVVRVVG